MVPLTVAGIPAPDADLLEVWRFALQFDGYGVYGSNPALGEVANRASERWHRSGELPSDPVVLRSCLFFEQRRWRHLAVDPTGRSLEYVRALVESIRAVALTTDDDAPGSAESGHDADPDQREVVDPL